MVWQASQSVRVCHGGAIAGLNECTNGCMSVVLRSCFSYQVAAGSTTSEKIVVLVIRKSSVSSRSSLPSGASSRQRHVARALALGRLGGADRGVGAEQVLEEVLVALARGAEQVGPPDRQHARVVLRRVRVLAGEAAAARTLSCSTTYSPGLPAGASASSARSSGLRSKVGYDGIQPIRARLGDHVGGGHAGELPLAGRRGERVGAELVVAELVGVQVPERGLDHLRGGRFQSGAMAIWV